MRAVVATEFGGPEVLAVRELPDPVPGPGEAVIGVGAADVIFLDTTLRRRGGGDYFTVTPPYVPGGGVAGQVLAGGDGVGPGWAGRSVVARTGIIGGYAERAVVTVDQLVPVPAGLDLPAAAAMIHDGITGRTRSGGASPYAASRTCSSAGRRRGRWPDGRWPRRPPDGSARSSGRRSRWPGPPRHTPLSRTAGPLARPCCCPELRRRARQGCGPPPRRRPARRSPVRSGRRPRGERAG